jgi:hypothetical protein
MEQSVVTFGMISLYFSCSEARQMSRLLARKNIARKSTFTKKERERKRERPAGRRVNLLL